MNCGKLSGASPSRRPKNKFRRLDTKAFRLIIVSTVNSSALWVLAAILMIGLIVSASAEEQRVEQGEIVSLLAGNRVIGKDFEQSFGDPAGQPSASTTYWQGNNASYGRWWVENDQYCSVWPPNTFKSCYDVLLDLAGDAKKVIWLDDHGNRFEGKLEDK